jgi:nucleotide-binding universal stress UspA family protein
VGPIVCGVTEPTGGAVARLAALLSERLGLPLALVHVLAPPAAVRASALPHAYVRLAADYRSGTRMLMSVAGELGLDESVETWIEIGPAAARLVAVAKAEHAEMIVLGRHDRGVLEAALVGSVSAEVARRAPCPVMIVLPSIAEEATAVLEQASLAIEPS